MYTSALPLRLLWFFKYGKLKWFIIVVGDSYTAGGQVYAFNLGAVQNAVFKQGYTEILTKVKL